MLRFLVGLGLGYALGLIVAPAPGEQTRRELLHYGEQKLAETVEAGRERTGEIARQAGEKAFDEAAKRALGEDVVDRSRRA